MLRIGHGYDVHKLTEGRKLILGGVEIAHPTGLLGHSDADVLTHAICDALLGAAAAVDAIGVSAAELQTVVEGLNPRFREANLKALALGVASVNK
jgi:2-C-methyl-D-erythritol 2,4-cyclodiphosphate synthase